MYKPIYKASELEIGKGVSAIVTGWTNRGQVLKHLNEIDYAVIGNLYDPFIGLNYLIANILANPQILSIEAYCDLKNRLSVNSLNALSNLMLFNYIELSQGFRIFSDTEQDIGFVSESFSRRDLHIFCSIPFRLYTSIEKLKKGLSENQKGDTSPRIARIISLNESISKIPTTSGKVYNHCL